MYVFMTMAISKIVLSATSSKSSVNVPQVRHSHACVDTHLPVFIKVIMMSCIVVNFFLHYSSIAVSASNVDM